MSARVSVAAICLLWAIVMAADVGAAEALPAAILAARAKLEKIDTYELDVVHTGTLKATGAVIWRGTTRLKWRRPGLVVQRSRIEGLLANNENRIPGHMYGEYLVFDGTSLTERTTTWLSKDEQWGAATVKHDTSVLRTGKTGLAPHSDYVSTAAKLLRSYTWTLRSRNGDTVLLEGRYLSEDFDHEVPSHLLRKWKWGPAGSVNVAIDTKRSLLIEYSFVKRRAPWGKRVGEVVYRTKFQNIRINPTIDASEFSFVPEPGEKIEHRKEQQKLYSLAEQLSDQDWSAKHKLARAKVQLFPKRRTGTHAMGMGNYGNLPICVVFTEATTQQVALLVNEQDLALERVSKILSRLSATAHARIESYTYAPFQASLVVILHSSDRLPCLLAYCHESGLGLVESPLGRGYFRCWTRYRSKQDAKLRPKEIRVTDLSSLSFPESWREKTLQEIFEKEQLHQLIVYERSDRVHSSAAELWEWVAGLGNKDVVVNGVTRGALREFDGPCLVAVLAIMKSGRLFSVGLHQNGLVVADGKGRCMVRFESERPFEEFRLP